MLRHPTLITSSLPGRLPQPGSLKVCQLMELLDRAPGAWYSWHQYTNDAGAGKAKKYPGSPVPQYVSAYLQLLAHTHPTYVMQWVSGGPSQYHLAYPRPHKADADTVMDWRIEHDVSAADIIEAFAYTPDINKQHSVRLIGNDPVRWMLLRLMANDKRCGAAVTPRAAESADASPTITPAETAPSDDHQPAN